MKKRNIRAFLFVENGKKDLSLEKAFGRKNERASRKHRTNKIKRKRDDPDETRKSSLVQEMPPNERMSRTFKNKRDAYGLS